MDVFKEVTLVQDCRFHQLYNRTKSWTNWNL